VRHEIVAKMGKKRKTRLCFTIFQRGNQMPDRMGMKYKGVFAINLNYNVPLILPQQSGTQQLIP